MASGMSHQINNRFNVLSVASSAAMLYLSKLTDGEPVTEEKKKALDEIKHALQRIKDNSLEGGEVVKSLLNFSRPAKETMDDLDVKNVLENSLKLLEHQIKLDNIDIKRELPDNLPKIRGNRNHLQETFFNLAHNAYKAMKDKKKGTLTVSVSEVPSNGHIVIRIKDTGKGIPRKDLPHIFTPFFTSTSKTISNQEGYGLGLFVCQKIINQHGGEIIADSEEGQWTEFRITLPVFGGWGGESKEVTRSQVVHGQQVVWATFRWTIMCGQLLRRSCVMGHAL
jgi:signal transduction histidine kinase